MSADRPVPAAGQVWSAVNGGGRRRYIRIAQVRLRKTDDAYVNRVEILPDGTRAPGAIAKDYFVRCRLVRGEMPPEYTFEPAITASTTTDLTNHHAREGTDSAAEAQETTMSANPTTTETTPATKNTKKAKATKPGLADRIAASLGDKPGIPADGIIRDPEPTAADLAGPSAAERIAALKENPTPQNAMNVLLGGPVTKKAKAAKKPAVSKAAEPKPPKTKKAKAEGAAHFTDERIAAFFTGLLKKDAETNRTTAIKAYRAAGHPGGEIRLREAFDATAKAFRKGAKK